MIESESKFNPDARSSAGAIGLMQLTPATAKGIAQYTGGSRFRLSDLTNPDINMRYGAWYLGHLLAKYGNERLALAAYNAGQDNVDRWQREHVGIQFDETQGLRRQGRAAAEDLPPRIPVPTRVLIPS